MDFIIVRAISELRKDGDTYFKCPFCCTSYNKNNRNPLKKATRKFHSLKSFILENPDKIKVKDNKVTIELTLTDIPCFKIPYK